MSAFEISYVVLWILVALNLLATTGLFSAIGAGFSGSTASPRPPADLNRRSGLEVGQQVVVPMSTDSRGRALVAYPARWIFVSPDCPACDAVRTALQEETDLFPRTRTIVVIDNPTSEAMAEWELGLPDHMQVVDDTSKLFRTLFDVPRDPYFASLDDQGRCLEHRIIPVDLDARRSMRSLVEKLIETSSSAPEPATTSHPTV